MSGCCGPMCSKTFVILYNIIFWVSGCAMVGVGVVVLLYKDFSHLYTLFNQQPEKYPSEYLFYGAYAIIGLGGLVLFIGFFGCCGALQESKCMLGTYIFFLILICFVEAVISLGCVYCYFSFSNADAKTKLKDQLPLYNTTGHEEFTVAIDYAQATFKCCGITQAKDHDDIRNNKDRATTSPSSSFPLTCCILKDEFQVEDIWIKPNPINQPACQDHSPASETFRYTQGCWKELENWLKLYILIFAGSSGGLAILQIFGVLFSLCLIRNVGEEA